MRWLWPIAALALTGCVSGPPVGCQQAAFTAQSNVLASQGYALAGRVISLAASGKIPGSTAIQLNAKLQTAQADIRAGKTAEAQALIDSVKGELP